MKLGLGFILLNGNFILDQVLSLLGGKFDEVLAIDFGSTDGTLEILDKHKVKTLSLEWENSYSIARNHLMTFARTKGVTHLLMLDDDEVIFPEYVDALREYKEFSACSMPRINLLPMSRFIGNSYPDWQTRYLNLSYDIEFRNAVHEVPFIRNEPLPLQLLPHSCITPQITIYHYSVLKPAHHIWKKDVNYDRLAKGMKSDRSLLAPEGIQISKFNEHSRPFHGPLPISL